MRLLPFCSIWRQWLLIAVAVWMSVSPATVGAGNPRIDESALAPANRMAPSTICIYLYANGDPVMGRDPSGNFTLAEIQMVVADIGTLARMAQPVIRAYHFANTLLDSISLVTGVANLIYSGNLGVWMRDVMNEVARTVADRGISFSAEQAAEAFAENLVLAMPAAPLFAGGFLADVETGASFSSYLIYGPNLYNTNDSVAFPTGLRISGKPVQLTFGGKYTGRLAGIGIQTKRGNGTVNHLFYRMDVHSPNPGHGGGTAGTGMLAQNAEYFAPWVDGPFHFHVMKYNKDK